MIESYLGINSFCQWIMYSKVRDTVCLEFAGEKKDKTGIENSQGEIINS